MDGVCSSSENVIPSSVRKFVKYPTATGGSIVASFEKRLDLHHVFDQSALIMKQNTLPNTFKKEGKTGRFFLGAYHMVEARRNFDIANAVANREGRTLGSYTQHAWGCGCCVDVIETKPAPDYRKSLSTGFFSYPEGYAVKHKRKSRIAHEVDGQVVLRS